MLLNLRNRWLLGFTLCVSSSEGAAVIRLAGYPFPRVQEPTVLEALEEERVVAEEEEAVRQAQVGVVVTFVLNEWWLNLLSSRRFAAAPRVGLETRLW